MQRLATLALEQGMKMHIGRKSFAKAEPYIFRKEPTRVLPLL